MVKGWAQVGSSTIAHYVALNCVGGCGKYVSICGQRGWVKGFASETTHQCAACHQLLDMGKEFTDRDAPFELSDMPGLPPGQLAAKRWPVLHLGSVPKTDGSLIIDGLVEHPITLSSTAMQALPEMDLIADMHCIMRWTVEGIKWSGVAVATVLDQVKPSGEFVLAYDANDYFANLTIEDASKGLIAVSANNKPLEPEHGGPLRLVIPHLYAWKSVKWLRRLEFTDTDRPGTWEQKGLHNRGDVWAEERFATKSSGEDDDKSTTKPQ